MFTCLSYLFVSCLPDCLSEGSKASIVDAGCPWWLRSFLRQRPDSLLPPSVATHQPRSLVRGSSQLEMK